MKKLRSYLEMLAVALFVVLADQITKYIVRTNLALGETWMPVDWIRSFFRIVHWKNTGVAFGLFQGNGWIFTLIGLLVVVLIIVFYGQVNDASPVWRVALALELGGAVGNLIDRLNPELRYVVDFLWFGDFPVFNLADTAIVIGAFLLMIYFWKQDREETKKTERSENEVHA